MFVAIDIAFQTPHATGFDLAQPLVGLVHAGQLPATALPAIDAGLVPSFEAGARKGQRTAGAHDIETGYLTTLALRSGFTSLPLHDLDTAEPALIAERCALTRFILDRTQHLGRQHPQAAGSERTQFDQSSGTKSIYGYLAAAA